MRSMLWLLLLIAVGFGNQVLADPQAPEIPSGTVGIEGKIIFDWSGKPLEVAPIPDDSPVLLRIASVFAGDGDEKVYDLRWIAMLPGEHDLAPLLRHSEKEGAGGLPPLMISVSSLLKDDHDGGLSQIPGPLSPILGFPQWVLWAIAVGWLLLPLSILWVLRWLRRPSDSTEQAPLEPTLAELLRPLVEAALDGELDDAAKARLERLLLARWRTDLDLGSYRHGEGIQKLRAHPEAGLLLVTVEHWLHSGRSEAVSDQELEDLLAPYATPILDPIGEEV